MSIVKQPTPTQKPQNQNSRPVHSIRIGTVRASIWENRSGESTWYNVTVSRSYKDGDQWKNSDSFGRDDLLPLAKVVDLAHTWICERQTSG